MKTSGFRSLFIFAISQFSFDKTIAAALPSDHNVVLSSQDQDRLLLSHPAKIDVVNPAFTSPLQNSPVDDYFVNENVQSLWNAAQAKQELNIQGLLPGDSPRSRNVKGLQMLFVVLEGAKISRDDLQSIYDKAVSSSGGSILTTATIVDENDTNATTVAHKKEFNYQLSVSPCNDYATFIRSKDYAAYLKAYPSYPLPSDFTKVDLILGQPKPSNGTSTKSTLFTKAQQAYSSIMNVLRRQSPIAARYASFLSTSAVKITAKVNAKKPQLATDIATALGWPQSTVQIKEANDGKIFWDSPGKLPAEWLPVGVSSSLFSTSEAASVYSRYTKSWNRLFSAQGGVAGTLENKEGDQPLGVVTAISTSVDTPIMTVKADGDNLVETIYSKDSSGKISLHTRTTNANGNVNEGASQSSTVDYWSLAKDHRNIAYSLKVQFSLGAASALGQPAGLFTTTIYPLQRGFFTSLEESIDDALVDLWAAQAKANAAPTQQACASTHSDSSQAPAPGPAQSKLVVKSESTTSRTQAILWQNSLSSKPIFIGDVRVEDTSLIMINDAGNLLRAPLTNYSIGLARASGELQTIEYAGNASLNNLPQMNTKGTVVMIKTPDLLVDPNAAFQVPDGFTLTGKINLFGKADAQLYSSHSCEFGNRQIVVIQPGRLKISDYLPGLDKTLFSDIHLQNPQFSYNQLDTAIEKAGTWLDANITLSGTFQSAADVLSKVLNHDLSTLHVRTLLYRGNNWQKPKVPRSFTFHKQLSGLNTTFANILTINDVAVDIVLGRVRDTLPPYGNTITHDLGFSGSVQLHAPNDIAPLAMQFSLKENNGQVSMDMSTTDESPSFFGITGLRLQSVSMQTSFDIKSVPSTVNFVGNALISLGDTTITLDGYYNKDDWNFHGELQGFGFDDVSKLYKKMFGSSLKLSNHDIVFDNLDFLAGPAGITLTGKATIEGHTAAQAQIQMTERGVQVSGEIDDVHIVKGISLTKAAFNVFIGKDDSGTAVAGFSTRDGLKFEIDGEVGIMGTKILATMFLDRTSKGQTLWTLYGEFDPNFGIGNIAPRIKGTFLDVHINQTCLIISNMDQASAGSLPIPVQFPIVKGVQVAASMNTIAVFDKVMHNKGTPTVGMSLQAMYLEESSAFGLKVNLAVAQSMSMKSNTVTSSQVSLELLTAPLPTLEILASFFVKTAHQPDPLQFTGGLSANVDEAKLFVELGNEYWVNPFSLSPQLKIGPHPALQIGIVYESPIYPSEIGIAGGLTVGNVSGKAALSISDAPNDELIMMEVDDLGVRDVVDFASLLFQKHLPQVPDFLRFKKVSFYLSSGTTIGSTVYPAGASFVCDAIIFGKEAAIYVGVDKAQGTVAVNGTLAPIDIGPLHIGGVNKGQAAGLDVELGPMRQKIFINGDIRLATAEAMVYVDAELLPTPVFNISTKLAFSSLLDFELQAVMRGGTFKSLSDLKQLDFDVHVLFEQEILDFVAKGVTEQAKVAKKAIDGGIGKAQADVANAQVKFDSALKQAQSTLDSTQAAYSAKLTEAMNKLKATQVQVNQEIDRLTNLSKQASAKLSAAIDKAQGNLRSATEQQTLKIQQAQQAVKDAKTKGDAAIQKHIDEVNKAKKDMDSKFGSAISHLKDAQDKVKKAQSAVDSAKRDEAKAQSDFDHASWINKPGAGIVLAERKTAVGVVQTALKAAQGILDAAQKTVQGPGYKLAQGAIDTYTKAVNDAKAAEDLAMKTASSSLTAVTAAQKKLVGAASAALNVTKTTGQEAINATSSAQTLSAYQTVADKTIGAASSAVDALGKSTEKVAFDAANAALAVAKANTHDLDIAKNALKIAQESADAVVSAGAWIIAHGVNLLNIRKAEASGDLRAFVNGKPITFSIDATLAEQNVKVNVNFSLGQGGEVVKHLFEELINRIKSGVLKIPK